MAARNMPCKFILGISVALLIIGLSFGEVNVAKFYKRDMSPTGNGIKTVQKKNVAHCTIECARTEYCQSFSFGSKDCILWQAKFFVGDKNNGNEVLKPNTGYVYYHFTPALKLKFVKERLPFDKAYQECRKLKWGNLVIIRDQQTLDEVLSLIQAEEIWLGMNGTVDSGAKDANGRSINFSLYWADGRAFTIDQFHNFYKGYPNELGKVCVLRAVAGYINGQWMQMDCTRNMPYVCQYQP